MMKNLSLANCLVCLALSLEFCLGVACHADERKVIACPTTSESRTAEVTGSPGQRLYLYPSFCADFSAGKCQPHGYILTGDPVIVVNNCMGQAYVQFHGKKSKSQGWVDQSRLGFREKNTVSSSNRDAASTPGNGAIKWKFELTKGQQIPVCQAYLKRLRATTFDQLPNCGRPENDSVAGFEKLNRVPLDEEELRSLIRPIFWFTIGQNQYKNQDHPWSSESVRLALDLHAWRYLPPISLDNNGVPENIVIWHGLGADQLNRVCGEEGPKLAKGDFIITNAQNAYVLTPDNTAIDEAKTRELFANQAGGYPLKVNGQSTAATNFLEIGTSISIFKFEGKYYFDTFFDRWGDFEGKRRNVDLSNTLGVFVRQNAKTNEVCEYVVSGK